MSRRIHLELQRLKRFARSEAVSSPESFSGLALGTHYDADKAASRVALTALRSVVMDDGSVYNNVVIPGTDAPLSCDITVTGAGGLDTGSEAAGTPYKVYLIGKSSTQAKSDLRLLFHREFVYSLDQQQTSAGSAQDINGASTNQRVAIKYVPGLSGPLDKIDINIDRQGSPTNEYRVELWSNSGGVPGALLATAVSDSYSAARVPTSNIWVELPFRTPYSVVAATTYFLVIIPTYATSATDRLRLRYNASGTNQLFIWDGGTWTAVATATGAYKTYVRQNEAAVVMPTNYDQKCLLCPFVFNNASSNFKAFMQYQRRVMTARGGDWRVSDFNNTTPLLTDLSAYLPPQPVMVLHSGATNAAGTGTGVGHISTTDLNPNSGNDKLFQSCAMNSVIATGVPWFVLPPIDLEYQAANYAVSSSTNSVWVVEFEW